MRKVAMGRWQLVLVASAAEFDDFRFQPGNKGTLNAINKSKDAPVRFRIKGLVRTIADKVNVLLQVRVSREARRRRSARC